MTMRFNPVQAARSWRTLVAFAAALILTAVAVPAPVFAAGDGANGVTLTVDYGGSIYDGSPVVEPGTSYRANLQYVVSELAPGSVVTVTIPDGVTVPAAGLTVPSGNTIVESIGLDAEGNVVLTFKDPLGTGVNQGLIAFDFIFDEPESGTSHQDVAWSIDGEESSTTLIVRNPGDEFRPDINPATRKSVQWANLNGKVSTSADGVVTLDPSVTEVDIPYTLRVDSAGARTEVSVSDTISEYLSYDQSSFAATLTSWDADGFNRAETSFPLPTPVFAGQTFTFDDINIPADSYLELTYVANVRTDKVGELVDALQAQADAITGDNGGNFSVTLGNDAVIDGDARNASTSIGGTVPAAPSPALGNAFDKRSSLPGQTQIQVDALGELVDAVDVTYSFDVNLAEFDGFAGTRHELARNVVITDTLPAAIDWAGGSFVTSGGSAMTETDVNPKLTAAQFADDAYVGTYQVDGKTLMINVGKDTATAEFTIDADASIVSLAGMSVTENPDGQLTAAAIYRARNEALFTYSDDVGPRRDSVEDSLVQPKAPGSVIDDPRMFSKAVDDTIVLQPGQSAQVPYTFTVAAGAVADLATASIIDDIDQTVFDVSDLAAIKDSITGTYDYQGDISGTDFDVTLVGDDVVFTLSNSFGEGLPTWMDLDGPLTKRLQFEATFTTRPLMGKQTLEVQNKATIEGVDQEAYDWTSTATGSASTYGDELEVEKVLYAGNGEWTTHLRVGIDGDNTLETDEFIYRVRLIPHGNYSGVRIIPLADELAEGTTFLGFVATADIDSANPTLTDSVAMGANVTATYNDVTGHVEIEQDAGQVLPPNEVGVVNFKVRVTDFTEDRGITNSIGSSKATITPSNGFPIMVRKQDSVRPSVEITDRDARFTVTGPNGVVTEEAYVVGGQLVVAGDDGDDSAIVVPADDSGPPAGDYTVTETTPPAGYELTESTVVATIADNGSSQAVTLFNDPLPLFAIGDLVWFDEDQDGRQGADEDVLAGTGVELLDSVTGEVLASTVTDANGRYLFDLLPAGDYRVRFTLTDEQAAAYTFTSGNVGDDDAVDSDADRATGETGVITLDGQNSQLVSNDGYEYADVRALNGVDPTWDAGVVVRPGTVEVGDLVWIDENRDGRQDAGEPGIPGVTLVLTGPDNEPVWDVDGRPVMPVETDRDGLYLFPNLPVLEEGQSYTVTIDREASAEALAPYTPTVSLQGDREGDSSLWTADSQGLTKAGERDLTLDFGFVREQPPVDPTKPPVVDPETPGTSDESPTSGGVLSSTGAQVTASIAASILLLMLGAVALAWKRRLDS